MATGQKKRPEPGRVRLDMVRRQAIRKPGVSSTRSAATATSNDLHGPTFAIRANAGLSDADVLLGAPAQSVTIGD
jgi:hypothetical protein